MSIGEEKKENCVFAGTFDPVTVGHEKIIRECIKRYARVFVVIGENNAKTPIFSTDERVEALKAAFGDEKSVSIVKFSDYKDDYARFLKDNGVTAYVRGIRDEKDAAHEDVYAEKNKKLYPFIKTVYIYSDKEYRSVSSSLVRERIKDNKDVTGLVSEKVSRVLNDLISKRERK